MRIDKSDFIWSYAANILNVSANAILLPFTLAFFNAEELGLWYVFASISTLVSLLDFGFTPTVSRNIAYSWSGASALSATSVDGVTVATDVDPTLFNTILQTCKAVYLIIALVALLILATAGTGYIWIIANESSCPHWMEAWTIYAFTIVLNLLFTYANAYLRGIGAVAEGSKASVAARLIQLGATIFLLIAGLGLLATSIGFFLSMFVFRVLSKRYFEKNAQVRKLLASTQEKASMQEIKAMFFTIWPTAWRDGLVSLSTFLSTQINTLICSLVLGLASTGFYGLALQISSVIMTIGGVWYSTIQPKLQELAVKKERQQFASLFAQSVAIYVAAAIPMTIATALVLPPLIHLLKDGIAFDVAMYVVVCFYMFIYRGNAMCISAISNFNIVPYTRSYIITGIGSVALSFALASFTGMGIWSLIIAPCIVFMIYNAWRWPLYLLRMLGTSALEFAATGMRRLIATAKHVLKMNRTK